MALTKTQQTKWAGTLIGVAQEASIVASLTDGEYASDVNGAKIVRVNSITDPTVGPYSGSITYSDLTDSETDLIMDQKNFISFKVEDIDSAQSGVDVKNAAIKRGGVNLALAHDAYAFGLYGDAGNQINDGATPTPGALDVNSKNVVELFLKAGRIMDEHNVPLQDRNIVIMPWLKEKLVLASYLRDTAAGDEVYSNGLVGKVLGFNVFVSNQLTAGHALALTSRAIAFANQINKVREMELEGSFSTGVSALDVFGATVMYPDELIDLWVAEKSES